MRLPEKNSRGEIILLAFLQHGPMTIYQGAERHGEFASAWHPDGIEHSMMERLYANLVDRGCLIKEGIMYRLSLAARHAMERKAAGPDVLSIVPPRIRNFLATSLCLGIDPARPNLVSL